MLGDLWASDLQSVFHWSPDRRHWDGAVPLPRTDESALDLVVVAGRPVMVYDSHLLDVLAGRSHRIPELVFSNWKTNTVRALDVHVEGATVWIGTGYGEWGGALVGFSLDGGGWFRFVNDMQYATGITDDGNSLWVSWSMSHFFASAMVCRHRSDGMPERCFKLPDGSAHDVAHYIQKLSWDADSQALLAVEQNELVRLDLKDDEMLPHNLGSFGPLKYGSERQALGVAPGITAMRPIGGGRMLFVHQTEPPRVYVEGKIIALEVRE